MKQTKSILLVVGAQYGSEAKGLVAGELCKWRKVDWAVRTGAINAGHTVYYENKPYKMQLVPVGWINPQTKLVLGAGAYISPEVLDREVKMINEAMGGDVRERLYIDERCGIHLPSHHQAEQDAKLHEKMGSTGEGVMEAIVDKMRRSQDYKLFAQTEFAQGYQICDTVATLNSAYDNGEQILLEGTQGTLLDLHLGYYPFVTSRQTTAAAWVTEAGLSPALRYEIVLVTRTFPIRVAGNSGPLPEEVSWLELTRGINARLESLGEKPVVSEVALRHFEQQLAKTAAELGLPNTDFENWDKPTRRKFSAELSAVHKKTLEAMPEHHLVELKKFFEMTTVTKKLRRIANLSMSDLQDSIRINRPQWLSLMFLNYKFPLLTGCKTKNELLNRPTGKEAVAFIAEIEEQTGIPVKYINTSANNLIVWRK